MFLTGYQTDFGRYLTYFCTHSHSTLGLQKNSSLFQLNFKFNSIYFDLLFHTISPAWVCKEISNLLAKAPPEEEIKPAYCF